MAAEREALGKELQSLTKFFPTEVGRSDFVVNNSGSAVQNKIDATTLRICNNKTGNGTGAYRL